MAEENGFLSRWSQRKRAVEADETSEPAPPAADEEPEVEEDEDALLERLGLPVPETLVDGDDFSAFMKTGVPEFLRKRALRVLWRSNPVLANLDGLNDYDDDFNAPELNQKVLATGYQIGRGFVKQVLEEEPEEDAEPAEDDELEMVLEPDEPLEKSADFEPHSTDSVTSKGDELAHARPRRMRFET